MNFNILGVKIKISYLLISLLALFSLFDKTYLALSAFFAALIHESGHILSAALLGAGVKELAFMPFGIRMRLKIPLDMLHSGKKIIILSAGCVFNLFCFVLFSLLSSRITDTALIHLVTAIFNLLPSGTLDGGRILLEILSLKLSYRTAERILSVISLFSSAVLFLLGAAVLIKTGYNISLLITSVYLCFMVIIRQKKLK